MPLLGELELLAGQIGAARQSVILGAVRQTAARGTEWFLRNLAGPVDIAAAVDRFAAGISDLMRSLDTVLTDAERRAFGQAVDHYLAQGMAAGSGPALRRAALSVHGVRGGRGRRQGRQRRGRRGQRVLRHRRLPAPRPRCATGSSRPARVITGSAARWPGLYDDLIAQHRRLTIEAFASGRMRPGTAEAGVSVEERVDAWLNSAVTGFARWQRLLAELERQPGADLAMLSVAVRSLERSVRQRDRPCRLIAGAEQLPWYGSGRRDPAAKPRRRTPAEYSAAAAVHLSDGPRRSRILHDGPRWPSAINHDVMAGDDCQACPALAMVRTPAGPGGSGGSSGGDGNGGCVNVVDMALPACRRLLMPPRILSRSVLRNRSADRIVRWGARMNHLPVSQAKETELFFRQWLRSPKSMGAVIPSSRVLARAVTEAVRWRAGTNT